MQCKGKCRGQIKQKIIFVIFLKASDCITLHLAYDEDNHTCTTIEMNRGPAKILVHFLKSLPIDVFALQVSEQSGSITMILR